MDEQDIARQAYQNALAKRQTLVQELERIDRFLADLREYAGMPAQVASAAAAPPAPSKAEEKRGAATAHQVKKAPKHPGESHNPPPEELVRVSRETILQRQQPMTRRQLVDALAQKGLKIVAKHPVNYLGTIIWRSGGQLKQIEGLGYWPADVAYPPAGSELPLRDESRD